MIQSEEAPPDQDAWVLAAMLDDSLVAEMLMRLSEASDPAPLKWGVRLPRSKQPVKSGVLHLKKEEEEATRASPTTPLSWSGGSSSSIHADVCEDSSRSKKRPSSCLIGSASGSRTGASQEPRMKAVGSKASQFRVTIRNRKKKTFAELKQEENLLLMEKVKLNKELDSMRAAWKEIQDKNENLKKLKLTLESQSAVKTSSKASAHHQAEMAFELPDLNLLPVEEDVQLFC